MKGSGDKGFHNDSHREYMPGFQTRQVWMSDFVPERSAKVFCAHTEQDWMCGEDLNSTQHRLLLPLLAGITGS